MSRVDATLGLNTEPWRRGMAAAQQSMGQFQAGAQRSMRGLMRGMSFAAVIMAARRIGQEFDEIAKLSKRLGVGSDEMQRLGHAAKVSGTSVESVAKAMTMANRNAQAAATGSSEMADAFRRLKIDVDEFRSLGLNEQLARLAEAFAGAGDRNAAFADIMKVAGRSAGELIPLLQKGADGIRALGEAAYVASPQMLALIEESNDRMALFTQRAKAAGAVLVGTLGGAIMSVWELAKRAGESWVAFFTGDFKHAIDYFRGDAIEAMKKPWEEAKEMSAAARESMLEDLDAIAAGAESTGKTLEKAFASYYKQREKDMVAEKWWLTENEKRREAARRNVERLDESRRRGGSEESDFAKLAQDMEREGVMKQRSALQARFGTLGSAMERVTGRSGLESVGIGLAGVGSGGGVEALLARQHKELLQKQDDLIRTIEDLELDIPVDEF